VIVRKIYFRPEHGWVSVNPYTPDLRPGNRGIGVSAAVEDTNRQRGFGVLRETLNKLAVEDIVTRTGTVLEPGTALTLYRIERNSRRWPGNSA
jgi:hypothetical protein